MYEDLYDKYTEVKKVDSDEAGRWYLGAPPKYDFVSFRFRLSLLFFDKTKIYVSYIILYNTLIPLSMYVSMEVVRVTNAQFINNDIEMYDEKNDIPSAARNTNILEELGQIQYLLSGIVHFI